MQVKSQREIRVCGRKSLRHEDSVSRVDGRNSLMNAECESVGHTHNMPTKALSRAMLIIYHRSLYEPWQDLTQLGNQARLREGSDYPRQDLSLSRSYQ